MGGETSSAPWRGGPRRSAQVDSVRALAALSILLFHALLFGGADRSDTLGPLTFPLESGVTVFLVLSGFLLFRPFARAHIVGHPSPATLPYAARGFMRIFRAYWVALVICALV